MGRPNLIERRMSRFLREPVSVRGAAHVIVVGTVLIVVISGFLMTIFDRSEYPNIWLGMWWAVQTVTTVGYGDVTPTSVWGRLVAAGVMLQGIAVISILTAAITSSFVARARGEAAGEDARVRDQLDRVERRCAELSEALQRVERTLRDTTGRSAHDPRDRA